MDNFHFGCNLSQSDKHGKTFVPNLKDMPKFAKSIGASSFQVFLRNSRSYESNYHNPKMLKKFNKRRKKRNIVCVVHGSFIMNFAWPSNAYQHYKGVNILVEDLNYSVSIGSVGVVIHMGKNVEKAEQSKGDAFDNYVIGLESALKKSDKRSIIILETGAGCGTEICTSIKMLGKIRDSVDKKYRDRIKFCLDTCHIYSAGYPINDIKYIDVFEMMVEIYLGWDNVVMIHLNDSKAVVGSCVDRHADIGKGHIGFNPLIYFINMCRLKGIPQVLETPEDTHDGKTFLFKDQIKLVRDTIKKIEKGNIIIKDKYIEEDENVKKMEQSIKNFYIEND